MYTSQNNWYSWQYGTGPLFGRQNGDDIFITNYTPYYGPVHSFKQELIDAVKSIYDHYSGDTLSIFFSGGVDSELILRSCIESKVNFKTYIVRYNNDYNIHDVSYAVTICNILNVEYKILDLNLDKFYENEAEKYSELAQIDRPKALPYCKFLELVDGIPIIGGGDVSLIRTDDDYSKRGIWKSRCWEFEVAWSKFALEINRNAVPCFFKWTPGLVIGFLNLEWSKKLISDQYYGKLGIHSTKLFGFREAYPDLIPRVKHTGFEKIDHLSDKFEKFLMKKYKGLPYRQFVDRDIDSTYVEILGNTIR